jgi:hypothetical protein
MSDEQHTPGCVRGDIDVECPCEVQVEIDMDECSVEGCTERNDLAMVVTKVMLPMFGSIEVEIPMCSVHLAALTADDLHGLRYDGANVGIEPDA